MDSVEEVMHSIIQLCAEQKSKLALSNRQIADIAGLSVSYVSRFINGKTKDPYLRDIYAMAIALEFNIIITIE